MATNGENSFGEIEPKGPFWHSPYNSNCTQFDNEINGAVKPSRNSYISSSSFDHLDLECGNAEIEVSREESERDCRICHLSLTESRDSGVTIVLGCSCKDDLAAAHKLCAETWFKIKGNKTCEICGSTAKNVVTAGEAELNAHSNETNTNTIVALSPPSETQSCWQGHRFVNFLLACMIFAFVISWLFHFNVPG